MNPEVGILGDELYIAIKLAMSNPFSLSFRLSAIDFNLFKMLMT
jgi:hypothetical protein